MNLRGPHLTSLVLLKPTKVTEPSGLSFLAHKVGGQMMEVPCELCNSIVPWCLCMRLS